MKQVFGFLIILLAVPALIIVNAEIVVELDNKSTLNEKITNSIELTAPVHSVPVVMKDKDGAIFSEEYVEWRTPLTLGEIPLIAKQIFLESEDNEFYEHRGYDVAAIARAFLMNTSTDHLSQGASTITQQLVRMRFLSTEKTYERKLTELFFASELEKQMTKDEILESYLNEMYFGNRVYGIGGAATYYFSRPLSGLNEAEIAFIAAIPNNPSMYDPVTHFDETKKRQERLLDTLEKNWILSQDEVNEYKELPIDLMIKKKENNAPTYSSFVLGELEELIGTAEGYAKRIDSTDNADAKNDVTAQLKTRVADVLATGIIVNTAYNAHKQTRDEQAVSTLLSPENLQAGAVVIDNGTREIVSVYGGKNYAKSDFHRAYQAVRQPGSAMKPLLVYAPLFESGRISENMPINSGNICIGNYCPKNIGGYIYGYTSIKDAFRHSHNTSAVRLFQGVGIEESFAYMKPFNFRFVTEKDKTYAAALGGFSQGVTPLELAGAYSSFIDGLYVRPYAIRSVKDRAGNTLYEWDKQKTEVWSPRTVETIRRLLQDVVVNGTGKGISYTTAYTGAKTGTTDHYKDLWTAGLSDHYTTAVWIGYDTPLSMEKISEQKIQLRAFSALLRD